MNHEYGINAINVPFDRAKRIINDLNEFGNYGEKGRAELRSVEGIFWHKDIYPRYICIWYLDNVLDGVIEIELDWKGKIELSYDGYSVGDLTIENQQIDYQAIRDIIKHCEVGE